MERERCEASLRTLRVRPSLQLSPKGGEGKIVLRTRPSLHLWGEGKALADFGRCLEEGEEAAYPLFYSFYQSGKQADQLFTPSLIPTPAGPGAFSEPDLSITRRL